MATRPRTTEAGDQPTYFELTTEIDPADVPEPIRVPTGAGKHFVITPPDGHALQAMRVATTLIEHEKALLGDAYDAAIAFYGPKPRQYWTRFIDQVGDHFFGNGASQAPGKSPA